MSADLIAKIIKTIHDKVRDEEDRINGRGSFDKHVAKGDLMARKGKENLTEEEEAFLESPSPNRMN